MSSRTDGLRSLYMLVTLAALPVMGWAQTAPSTAPATAPGVAPPSVWEATSAPATAPALRAAGAGAQEPPAANAVVAQPFVGTVTTDRVYVRSGPGTAYYEMGQLDKGDLVYVVGAAKGWYQILPPNGAYCMIAKEFVQVDPSGTSGTVKGDYVNVRAGTALNKERDPIAVLAVVRKGTKLTILGGGAAADKYYMVAPTEKAYVYVHPQFVTAAPGVAYKVPDLKLPAGVTGPAVATVGQPAVLPTGPATPTVEIGARPGPAVAAPVTPVAEAPTIPLPEPKPTVVFDASAATKYADLNARLEAETKKPLPEQDLEGLAKEYKALAGLENAPPSVKIAAESQAKALDKALALQKLARDNAASDAQLAQQRQALQEQYATAQKAVDDYLRSGPYLAEGTLQTSTVVTGKYALVNPNTGRVVAYIDPQANIDIASLLGKYIAVRGTTKKVEGSAVSVIQVDNATLLPAPKTLGSAGQ